MITDQNIGIEIKYNYLNLPTEINWTADQRKIEFTYSASGAKLQNKVYDETGNLTSLKDFAGGFEYERYNQEETPDLFQFPFSEGRVLANGNSFEYEYAMKDHLGNTRLSFDENKYLYNGKELVDANVEWKISISI